LHGDPVTLRSIEESTLFSLELQATQVSKRDKVAYIIFNQNDLLTKEVGSTIIDNSNYYHSMLRKTKQREVILKVLRDTTSHPTADWIYNEARKEVPDISLGTVYRNLRLLRECGKIVGIDLGGTSTKFDGNSANHYHFRCEECRCVFDVDEPVDERINKRVARKTGFKISHHWLEFRGLCKECQKV
jgi:Fur family peroxide stress response transcriptional regulator